MSEFVVKRMTNLALIQTMSWNISAVNNNPFEYWTLFPDDIYENLMIKIQQMIETPECDLEINQIFLDSMFSELVSEMSAQKISGLQELERYWKDDYRLRKSIHGFLKDKLIGTKRLASMPDRITNTINLSDGGVCHRPSAINAYRGGSLTSIEQWWSQWKTFLFHTRLHIYSKASLDPIERNDGKLVCNLILPILRGKYPAISEEEQAISVPLQILCLAILDAIFIHILNSVGQSSWEHIRLTLCDALIYGKLSRICKVIGDSYADCDVMFIQEAAAVLEQELEKIDKIRLNYATLVPKVLDGKRDQNSFILVKRNVFDSSSVLDVTQIVLDNLGGKWLAPGDLLVVSVEEKGSRCRWLMASFHGDSEGLATQPTLLSLLEVADSSFGDHTLLIGLDANTRSGTDCQYQQSVAGFAEFVRAQRLVTIWDPAPDPAAWTTCSSRTYMQTQLNKAVGFPDRFARAQRHLKDWILASSRHVLHVADPARDNTGARRFEEGTTLPTIDFPSDHAIVSAAFHLRQAQILPSSRSASIELWAPPVSRTQTGERTLYDYWGIGSRPLAADLGMDTWRVSSKLSIDAWRMSDINTETDTEELSDEGELLGLLHKHYLGLAMGKPWNKLDRVKAYYSKSSDRSIWILFSRYPLSLAFRHTWVRILLAIAMTAFLVQGCFYIAEVSIWSVMQCHHLRFTALSLRNASAGPPQAPGIAGLGMLRGGCRDIEILSSLVWDGPTVVASYPAPITFSGWWFQTNKQESALDAAEYKLECSPDDDGKHWNEVTKPSWMSSLVDVPLKRDAFQIVDFTAPIVWILDYCFAIPAFSFSGYVACLFGLLQMGREGALAFAGGFLILATVQLIWALDWLIVCVGQKVVDDIDSYNVNVKMLWPLWFYCINSFCLCAITFTEVYALDYYFVGFLATGLVSILSNEEDFKKLGGIAYSIVAIWSLIPSAVVLGLILVRYRTSRWVVTGLISSDQAAYEEAWQQAKIQNEELTALALLELSIEELKVNLPSGPVRQCRSSTFLTEGPDHLTSPYSLERRQSSSIWEQVSDSGTLIQSLDQLMDQAKCLNIYLKAKCKEFALVSNGFFQVADCAAVSFQKFDEASCLSHTWKFSDIKPHKRALEKLLRSYDCDASRLLDCCRQRIVFELISDLHACLNAVRMDREIKIVRLKNNLSQKADVRKTGGFRHVVLNVCLKNFETTLLGVDNHVCELQLVLKSFAEKMTDESHNRYRILRNCRDAPSVFKGCCSIISFLTAKAERCCNRGQSIQQNREELFRGGVVELVTPGLQPLTLDIQNCQLGFLMQPPSKPTNQVSNFQHFVSNPTADSMSFLHIDARQEFLQAERKRLLCRVFRESMMSSTRYAASSQFGSFGKGKILEVAARRAASGSVWDTCYPFATLLCKPWFPLILTAILVYLFLSMAANASLIWQNNSLEGRKFRFSPIQLRNAPLFKDNTRVVNSIRLLQNGCGDRLSSLHFNHTFEHAGKVVLEFPELVVMNGWSLSTHEKFADLDPVRFTLERSVNGLENEEKWEVIGGSWGWWTWSGDVVWDSSIPWNTVTERNVTYSFYLEVPWVWSAQRMATQSLFILMDILLIFCAVWKHQLEGRLIAALFMFLNGLSNGLAGIVYVVGGQWKIALVAFGHMVLDMLFPFILLSYEKYLSIWLGIAGVTYPGLVFVHDLALLSCPECLVHPFGLGIVRNLGILEGFVCLFLFVSAVLVRRRSRRTVLSVILEDQAANDRVWSVLCSDQCHSSSLEEVSRVCGDMQLHLRASARQKLGNIDNDNPQPPPAMCVGCLAWEKTDPQELAMMQKLEQLFIQSVGLDLFLREKCKHWALQAGGSFPVGGDFERWERLVAEGREGRVRWASPKGWDRAAEKLFLSYEMDPSRLLDCCRQSIFFEDPAGLARCLQALRADGEARLARVSNRLRAGYDAAATAGYRDVRVNLALESRETRRLGVHLALCELQLALIPFARHKTDATHARYIRWRNVREL